MRYVLSCLIPTRHMPVPSFQLFGLSHVTVLMLTALAAMLMIRLRTKNSPWATVADYLLMGGLVLQWPMTVLAHRELGDLSLQNALPFHLCDVAAWAGVVALLTRHRLAAELCYFFGLTGTLQGLITPALSEGFPHLRFIAFFMGHSSVVIAAVYLVAGLKLTPRHRAPARMLGWLVVYAISVGSINAMLHTNYGFVCAKPPSPSLMDVLGPWPWYVVSLSVVGFVIFSLLDLPFIRQRKMDLSLPSKCA